MTKTQRSLIIDNRNLLNRPFRVAILLNSKFSAHCRVLSGITDYVRNNKLNWSIVLNHELRYQKGEDLDLYFDGIIADYNQPHITNLLEDLSISVVGLTSGMDKIPSSLNHPIVSLDNKEIISMAHNFLMMKGLNNIAYYGLNDDDENWKDTRVKTYLDLQCENQNRPIVYFGKKPSFTSWTEETEHISHWLNGLPKPCGIIVTSDIRARTLLSVCEENEIMVPDEVAVVSVGDIQHREFFQSVSVSHVDPDYYSMGHKATKLLEASLSEGKVKKKIFISPNLVEECGSTDFRAEFDPTVMKAMHFIRNNYTNGIKVQQVVNFVGCSRTALEERFKMQTGHTIHHEIHSLKLNYACHLLRDKEDIPISEIAKKSGYPCSQYLYALFKKEFGVTPTQFKSHHREQTPDE